MQQYLLRYLLVLVLILLSGGPALARTEPTDEETANRAKLLSYVLRQQLTQHHFSDKEINDDFSQAAFDLYLKQLDFQKRFLLADDVTRLRTYADRIDDEINRGKIELPVVAGELMEKRIGQVQEMVNDLLARDFDFSLDEELQADPEKLDWSKNPAELKERWRKILKHQVMVRLLTLEEEPEQEQEQEGREDSACTDPAGGPGKDRQTL